MLTDTMCYIQTPESIDILCGKDKTYAKHPGNQMYRQLIEQKANLYCSEPSKQVKMVMTKEIVGVLESQGSRFLRKRGEAWEEISNQQARDKTSHALRFCAAHNPSKKKRVPLITGSRKSHRRTVSSDTSIQSLKVRPDSVISLFHRQQEILTGDFGCDTVVHNIAEEHPVPDEAPSRHHMASEEWDAILKEPLNDWDGLFTSS